MSISGPEYSQQNLVESFISELGTEMNLSNLCLIARVKISGGNGKLGSCLAFK